VLGERKVTQSESTQYAAAADFCRIFERDMNRLYQLSFLLTGNRALAEKCFVSGLEDARNSNPVFKEWADSWARRTIIRNAILLIAPQPADDRKQAAVAGESGAPVGPAELAAVLALPVFERFAFVMSVLEHYSEQECSLLLGCTRAEVVAARSRALRQLGVAADARQNLASVPANTKDELRGDSRPQIQLKHFARLAVPA
jgi:DNA-directed RNA polymerase specialized sigma24 family protein